MESPQPVQPASAAQLDALLRARRTRKVLDGPSLPNAAPGMTARKAFNQALQDAIAAAGWVPFHYPSSDRVPEPWRFTVLDRDSLDALVARFPQLQVGKLPHILAGAGALVQVTFAAETDPARLERNLDHHSATAAAAMALLLALEARGLGSYWCTARVLDGADLRTWCGIEAHECWIGSLFVGRPLSPEREATEGFAGKQAGRRTSPGAGWMRWREA